MNSESLGYVQGSNPQVLTGEFERLEVPMIQRLTFGMSFLSNSLTLGEYLEFSLENVLDLLSVRAVSVWKFDTYLGKWVERDHSGVVREFEESSE